MNFCLMCNNMLYPYENNKELLLKCKNCGFKKKYNDTIVFSKVYKEDYIKTQSTNNKFLIYDCTLPRTNKKKCPNNLW